MNLRSCEPWWLLRNGILWNYPTLERSVSCDVAIIGGGITGALIAQRLAELGLSVVVLDKRSIGEGSTTASTALLQYEVDTPLHRLERRVGAETAERVYRLGLDAIAGVERLSRRLRIECGFARRHSLQLASRERDARLLERETDARARLGFAVRLVDRERLARERGWNHAAALWSRDAAEVDPLRLTHGLLRRAIGDGARVFDRVAVTRVRHTARGVRLDTDRDATVRASHVVVATGYERMAWSPRTRTRIVSTFAMVTDCVGAIDGWKDRALLWETARPYVYLRRTDDDRVLIGGGDIASATARTRDRLIPAKSAYLARRLRRLFPSLRFDVDRAWAGAFVESVDSLPYIGRSPQHPRLLFALGYGGNGMTFGWIGAEILSGLVVDGDHPDATRFAFGRAMRA
jgi:glycine/D-amino acid oxidase-like deaminating enzyme